MKAWLVVASPLVAAAALLWSEPLCAQPGGDDVPDDPTAEPATEDPDPPEEDGKPVAPEPSDPDAAAPDDAAPNNTAEPDDAPAPAPQPAAAEPAAPASAAEPAEKPPSAADLDRRAAARQAALEVAEPRPPLADAELPEQPAWSRHVEIGGDFALVFRPFSSAELDNGTGYDPAPAWGLHLRWSLLSFLRFQAYFVDAHHHVVVPQGALVAKTSQTISPNAVISDASVATFVFGARLAPTWEVNDRLRFWLGAGIGWGRFEFPAMTATEPGGEPFEIRERDGVFVEFPFSIGGSYDLIDRWLAVELEVSAAPVIGQSGDAHATVQAVDAEGNLVDVGGFGAMEASFVNTIGLSLIL